MGDPLQKRPPLAKSTELPKLRHLIEAVPALRLRSPLRFLAILDTNVIYASIVHRVEKQRNPDATGDLVESLAAGVLVALAPPNVVDEVVEKLLLRAVERKTAAEPYLKAWTDLLPRIKVVAAWGGVRSQTRFARDPDDAPQILLQEQAGAAGVLSHDKDIAGMEGRVLAPEETLRAARDYARGAVVRIQVEGSAAAIGGLGVVSTIEATKAVVGLAKRRPKAAVAVGGAALLAAAAIWLNPSWRKKAGAFFEKNGQPIRRFWIESLLPALSEMVSDYQAAAAMARRAEEELRRRGAVSDDRRTVRQVAIAVLASASEPLSVEQIDTRALCAGYGASGRHRRGYLRRVLSTAPFERLADGRFQIRQAVVAAHAQGELVNHV